MTTTLLTWTINRPSLLRHSVPHPHHRPTRLVAVTTRLRSSRPLTRTNGNAFTTASHLLLYRLNHRRRPGHRHHIHTHRSYMAILPSLCITAGHIPPCTTSSLSGSHGSFPGGTTTSTVDIYLPLPPHIPLTRLTSASPCSTRRRLFCLARAVCPG